MFPDYTKLPDEEWTDSQTGQVYTTHGRVVITQTMLAVEDLWSQDFDREVAGELVADKPKTSEGALRRGTISEFTRASQVRMMKAMSSWIPYGRLMLITLTYPATYPDIREAKADLKRFKERLLKDYPNVCGVWKLEYQVRGAPHFHFVAQTGSEWFMQSELTAFQVWLNKAWQASRRSKEKSRNEAKFADDDTRAKFYLSKEIGKSAQASKKWQEQMDATIKHEGGGKFWGYHNKEIMIREQTEFAVPAHVAILIRQYIHEQIVNAMKSRWIKRNGKSRPYLLCKGDEFIKPNGKTLDEKTLPAWHLFEDGKSAFERMKDWLRVNHNIDFDAVCVRHKANLDRYDDPECEELHVPPD